ncbi:hypothetical protein GDO81_006381 [Engystomops pustulosus]|uniref:DM2 domain-containing protein n=1 Tax=Engystomops pustulosus TaxID=76066 RepID=A0AAV7CW88_ENGPU|nr:hypothetical protein GDO81_006381 [Engystomops pustulosus]
MSTSTSSQQLPGLNPSNRSIQDTEGSAVRPQPALLKLLHTAGAKGDTFTLKQVMHFLGQYIMVKQLYDKRQQHIVHCGDDELGQLLGITTFSVKDPSPLYEMLKKNLHQVSCTDAAQSPSSDLTQDTGGLERQKTSDEFGNEEIMDVGVTSSSYHKPLADDENLGILKHNVLDLSFEEWDCAGLPWWFLGNLRTNYNPLSNGSTDIPSNQDIDTALVSDTTDDLWFLNDNRSDQINMEVKVESLDSQDSEEGDGKDDEGKKVSFLRTASSHMYTHLGTTNNVVRKLLSLQLHGLNIHPYTRKILQHIDGNPYKIVALFHPLKNPGITIMDTAKK